MSREPYTAHERERLEQGFYVGAATGAILAGFTSWWWVVAWAAIFLTWAWRRTPKDAR